MPCAPRWRNSADLHHMKHARKCVLADDLTGAAEIAAIAWQSGRSAVVLTGDLRRAVEADVLVLNTDTRLASPATAARRVRACTRRLQDVHGNACFIKVDSVLRGSVLSHLSAAASGLGKKRALLVSVNPSLSRTLKHGHLFVGGVPLDKTVFAADPHHPRTTSDVRALLGASTRFPVTFLTRGDQRFPARGVIVGDTTSNADVRLWRNRLDHTTLPAGGADFFREWLGRSRKRSGPKNTLRFASPCLLLHGTTASQPGENALRFRGRTPPSIKKISAALAPHGAATVAPPSRRLTSPGDAAALATGFAHVAATLATAHQFQHLLIAGGATASQVLPALGWTALEVVCVWAPGVVTLRPLDDPGATVTLKPGSYPWPANLRSALPAHLLS
jgi:D-threonate/D-erythronate kinase